MKIKLSFTERFHLTHLMPDKDSRNNLLIRKDILKKIDPDQDEFKKREFKQDGKKASWKEDEKPETKEYEFTSLELSYLKSKLKKADESECLDVALIDTWDKIM